MKKNEILIGIDAGSTSASAVAMDSSGKLLAVGYAFHQGKVTECLRGLLDGLLPEGRAARIAGVARTATSPGVSVGQKAVAEIDSHVAEINAARRLHPECRSLIVVGAEKFARITFDADGRYRSMRGNSSCAAGTGSFLDQQSSRLGLKRGSAELAERALANSGERPSIASRCSVFAKTDLIHAQQEGWSVEEICDGLSEGLARNIADTLFPGERPEAPIFMAGGVSRNAAVLRHLSALAGSPIATDEYSHVYGALGACLGLTDAGASCEPFAVGDIALDAPPPREYANEALPEPSEGYPDFASKRRFLFTAKKTGPSNPVEVDVYLDAGEIAALAASGIARSGPSAASLLPVLLGLDIGSTSTKAALVAPSGEVVAGLYTRTAGRPLEATQGIFEAIESLERDYGLRFKVLLSATTGSGRKLVGSVIGADETIDEITAHARAAVDLDPTVDTIIEIGGQDSKFTLLKNGIVTFSQMNAVCAAGTGSFLEEQAARLGVPLCDFAARAIGQKAPLTSDRCTVFMERDLNHFQSLGYSTDELLAASLYSVCDNYLGKVAQRGSIGKRVAFQGATAKNRALVAVFERRLGKKIAVSKFCHLTGAIGSALQARDEVQKASSSFRGFGLWSLELPSRSERCGLCANDCRLRVIDVGGEEVAYGFLCGRDYGTKHFVGADANKHNYLPRRKKAIEAAYAAVGAGAHDSLPAASGRAANFPSIGIPSALYLEEDAPFWKAFFERLGFPCVAAPDDSGALRAGKRLAGAEFCAPMALLHGQVHSLLASADYVFLPTYLEDKPERRDGKEARRYYCNYSEYASAVTRCAEHGAEARILSPLLVGRFGDTSRAMDEMEAAIGSAFGGESRAKGLTPPSRREMDEAYAACVEARVKAKDAVRALFAEGSEPAVVLIGRPYAVLSEAMGKGIADMIAKRGVDVLYADMLPESSLEDGTDIDPLLAAFHWRYATEVLKAARFCAKNEHCYPVFVTSFKCSPDAFAIEWFKRILDAAEKPYLILQIDEHDSSVGYETRVEAGLRSFRNHFRAKKGERSSGASSAFPVNPTTGRELKGKVVLFPNWDPLVSPLLAANLRGSGIDARPLEESSGSVRRAMGSNTGQCIPINIIARDCAEYVERNHLDPANVVLWIAAGLWPCNLPLYPHYMKSVLEHQGGGLERIEVYNGDIFFLYVGFRAMLGTYHAFLAGGTLRKLACRTRPYEVMKGETDRLVDAGLAILIEAFEKGTSMAEAYQRAFAPFLDVKVEGAAKPKVAIFGDLYVRDNDVLNQNLIRTIEAAGGEAVVTPYLDYVKAVLDAHLNRLLLDRDYGEWAKTKAAIAVVKKVEKALMRRSGAVLYPPKSWSNPGFAEKVARFGIRPEQEGECFDNAVKIFKILEEYPDVSLFVQTNPAFCCPSIVSQAMTGEIERVTGVPVVTINYDGTGAFKNDALVPFLTLGGAAERRAPEGEALEVAPAPED